MISTMNFPASAAAPGLPFPCRLTSLREVSLRPRLDEQHFALTRGWGR
jgi:hypothetical protein